MIDFWDIVPAFTGEYFILSNYYPHGIEIAGRIYPSVEHYYQASKAAHEADHERVRCAVDPDAAKKLGRSVPRVEEWAERKADVMRTGLRAKFTGESQPGRALVGTGHAILVEGNDWGDTTWGVCDGRGRNLLGVLLMERRGELLAL